jgi:hypothetical protein
VLQLDADPGRFHALGGKGSALPLRDATAQGMSVSTDNFDVEPVIPGDAKGRDIGNWCARLARDLPMRPVQSAPATGGTAGGKGLSRTHEAALFKGSPLLVHAMERCGG